MSAPRWRSAAGLVGYLVWAIATAGVCAHFVGLTSTVVAWFAAFTPVGVVLSVIALVLLLIGGRRRAAVAATVVLLVGIGTQVPLYRSSAPPELSGPSVRVMQANIRLGGADAAALVDSVGAREIDVLTVIELTDSASAKLAAAGLENALPHTCVRTRHGGGGAGIYSRYPLRECAQLDGFVLNNLRAVAEIPAADPTAVYALHPLPPYPEPAWKWVYELKRLRPIFSAEPYPMIVGADFNSTYDHRQYRQLLTNSTPHGVAPLLDAAEHVGAGVVPTYPADRVLPPVLAIDRILTREWVPTTFARLELPGSDHLGVTSNLRLPGMNSN